MSKLASHFFWELTGSLFVDKNEKQWYFNLEIN